MRISFVNVSSMPEFNIGLAYLISAVENSGHDPKLIDLVFAPKNYIKYAIDEIRKQQPDVVGFSVFTSNYLENLQLAKKIKKEFPDLPIIFGGIHPSILPEETISNPQVDAICIGEGEESLPQFLDMLENGKYKSHINGIWNKTKNGKVIKNPLRPFIQNLNSLPFPNWDYWNIKEYLKFTFLYVSTSRGCPYDCSFCTNKTLSKCGLGKYLRIRSAESVIEEIRRDEEKYKKIGVKTINFSDPSFGINKKQFNEFITLYKKENLDLSWMCATRADVITEEWAKKAASTNCILVEIGLETGDKEARFEICNKKITNEQFETCAKNLKKYGIPFNFNMIIGLPNDTKNKILKSLKFAESLEPTYIGIMIYLPLPQTKLGDFCIKNEMINDKSIYYGLPHLEIKGLSRLELNTVFLKLQINELKKYLMKNFYNFNSCFFNVLIKNLLDISLRKIKNPKASVYFDRITVKISESLHERNSI